MHRNSNLKLLKERNPRSKKMTVWYVALSCNLFKNIQQAVHHTKLGFTIEDLVQEGYGR